MACRIRSGLGSGFRNNEIEKMIVAACPRELRSLPFKDSGFLIVVNETNQKMGASRWPASPADFLDLEVQSTVFSQIAAYRNIEYNLSGGEHAVRVSATEAFGSLFRSLGVNPLHGRVFVATEDGISQRAETVLGYEIWQRYFGGVIGALGKSVLLDGRPFEVIGVMPPGFRFPDRSDLWVPLSLTKQAWQNRDAHYLRTIARLSPGVSLEQARAQLKTISQRLEMLHPEVNTGWSMLAIPYREGLVRDARPTLLVLIAAVGAILLLACTSVGILLTARAAERQQEFAVRMALGAGWKRLARLLTAESLMITILAGLAGWALANLAITILLTLIPSNTALPNLTANSIDTRLLLSAMVVVFVTVLSTSLIPASLSFSEDVLIDELRQTGRGVIHTHGRLRNLLLISELTLSMILLIGAVGLVAHFVRLNQADPGFNAQNILTGDIRIPLKSYPTAEQGMAFFRELLERVEILPGVQSAGLTSILPMAGDFQTAFDIEGRRVGLTLQDKPLTSMRWVSPGFHRALQFHLIAGRLFDRDDTQTSPKVVVVDELVVKMFWGGQNPVGQRIRYTPLQGPPGPWITIVGVVNAARQLGLATDPQPTVYVPLEQNPDNKMKLVVRSISNAGSIAPAIAQVLQEMDRDVPLANVTLMEDIVANSVWRQRLASAVMTVFALAALGLTAIGIYSVISFQVAIRRKDIAVRMALGANRWDILRWIGRDIFTISCGGLLLGASSAWGVTRLLSSISDLLDPIGLRLVCAVSLFFVIIIVFASYIPLQKAVGVDANSVLR